MKKIVGIFVCTLLIATAIPAISMKINNRIDSLEIDDGIDVDSISKVDNDNVCTAPPFWWLFGSDQKQTSTVNYGLWIQPPFLFAQEFKPTKDKLTAVLLYLFSNCTIPGIKITVSIRNALDGSDLTLKTVDADKAKIKGSGTWVMFDFPDISVTPETTYYIICEGSGGIENDTYCWLFNISNPYPRGIAWSTNDSGETWFDMEDIWQDPEYPEWKEVDFCFVTYWKKPPRNRATNTLLQNFQLHLNLFPMLKILLQRLTI